MSRDGGDEGGRGETDAYGEFFGVAVGVLCGVDDDKVSEDQTAEDEIEADGCDFKAGKKDCQGYRGEDDSGEEGFAMLMVKVMAGFESVLVEEAVGGVEAPDGEEHGEDRGDGEVDVVNAGDEPGPESGYGGGVEGEEVPEGEGIAVADGLVWRGVWRVRRRGWRCGGH